MSCFISDFRLSGQSFHWRFFVSSCSWIRGSKRMMSVRGGSGVLLAHKGLPYSLCRISRSPSGSGMQSGSLYRLVTCGRHMRLPGSIGLEFSFSLRFLASSISSAVAAVAANEYVLDSKLCKRDDGAVRSSLEEYIATSSFIELPIRWGSEGRSYTVCPGVPCGSHACLRAAVSVSGVPSCGMMESRSSGGW